MNRPACPHAARSALLLIVVWGLPGRDRAVRRADRERVGTSNASALPRSPREHSTGALIPSSDPRPRTDGEYLYSGCYDPSPEDTTRAAPDRCFMTVDVSAPTRPVRLATVHAFDTVASPSPPPGHVVWAADYPFANLPVQVPCRVDWSDPGIAAGTQPPRVLGSRLEYPQPLRAERAGRYPGGESGTLPPGHAPPARLSRCEVL